MGKANGRGSGFRENNWRSVRAERTKANIGEGKAKFIFAARDKSVWKANPCCFVRASVCVPYSELFPIPSSFSSLSGIEKTSVPSLCTSGNVSLWKLQPNQITRHSLFSAQQLFPGTLNIHGLLATQLIPLRFGWKQDFSLVFAYLK